MINSFIWVLRDYLKAHGYSCTGYGPIVVAKKGYELGKITLVADNVLQYDYEGIKTDLPPDDPKVRSSLILVSSKVYFYGRRFIKQFPMSDPELLNDLKYHINCVYIEYRKCPMRVKRAAENKKHNRQYW